LNHEGHQGHKGKQNQNRTAKRAKTAKKGKIIINRQDAKTPGKTKTKMDGIDRIRTNNSPPAGGGVDAKQTGWWEVIPHPSFLITALLNRQARQEKQQ
jgi:hypothetical protein